MPNDRSIQSLRRRRPRQQGGLAGAADAGRAWAWSIDATGTALPAWPLTAPTAGTGDAFGHAIAPAPCAGDLDGNGVVDSADLGAL